MAISNEHLENVPYKRRARSRNASFEVFFSDYKKMLGVFGLVFIAICAVVAGNPLATPQKEESFAPISLVRLTRDTKEEPKKEALEGSESAYYPFPYFGYPFYAYRHYPYVVVG